MSEEDLSEQMADLAEEAVQVAKARFATELDFSTESIEKLERILDGIYRSRARRWAAKHWGGIPGEKKTWGWALLGGAYLGETIRRHWGGQWTHQKNGNPEEALTLWVRDVPIHPAAKVYHRLVDGPEHNVWHHYELLVRCCMAPA